ncbi:hypothetical protein MNBD_GAMMA21-1019 [hydrothermal vent metagenome]|uniref:Abasic site processing protein n=1 Tax=hydrothermal vent metagenome TaxID=652676 RepID=A0A3B1AR28_9ZZZZ
MCGRFTLGKEPNSLLDYFHLHGEVPNFNMPYNITPSQMCPIIYAAQQQRVCELMRWGLIPAWSKGPDTKFNMINARVESITEPLLNKDVVLCRLMVTMSGLVSLNLNNRILFTWRTDHCLPWRASGNSGRLRRERSIHLVLLPRVPTRSCKKFIIACRLLSGLSNLIRGCLMTGRVAIRVC